MPTATIKIFLVHGDPKRLRTAELSNWTGKAVAGPRSEFEGVVARGQLIPNGFLVLKGSQAVLHERPSSQKYPWARNMRQELKKDRVLVEQEDQLVFARDAEFSSPSAAAAVVHGGHANGLIAWKNSKGKTLKEIESV